VTYTFTGATYGYEHAVDAAASGVKDVEVENVVSQNGKKMTTTIKGADPQGKPFKQVAVFDKQ
jgi:hypothetical protein